MVAVATMGVLMKAHCAMTSMGVLIKAPILVVDDEHHILDVVKELLDATGFSVITASGGREAFMEMNRIRSDVPVIVASGYPEEKVSHRFKERMPAGFIKKPFPLFS